MSVERRPPQHLLAGFPPGVAAFDATDQVRTMTMITALLALVGGGCEAVTRSVCRRPFG